MPAKIKIPERYEVTINVINGTKIVGLAQRVGEDLKNRGFVLKGTATAAGNKVYPDDVAIIVYGPAAVGAAQLVRANFLLDEEESMQFDLNREGAEVDDLTDGGPRRAGRGGERGSVERAPARLPAPAQQPPPLGPRSRFWPGRRVVSVHRVNSSPISIDSAPPENVTREGETVSPQPDRGAGVTPEGRRASKER